MTTDVEFRTHVRDVIGYAERWLRKAVLRGVRVRVTGTADQLQQLDQLLWTADKEGFWPHARSRDGGGFPDGFERTPVWLGEGGVAGPAPGTLLNLGDELALRPTAYRRIIEVVGLDSAAVQAGRIRWGAYRQMGLAPVHHQPSAAQDEPG
jgi:DNA polymerase-3 subunit chi